ncbi:RNA polymerase II C-terminal domain kinase beta subunit [Rhodotorula kratochvilovae]
MNTLAGVPPPAALPGVDGPPLLAVTRDFRPYYAPIELDHLVHLQAHTRQPAHPNPDHPAAAQTSLSDHRIEHHRQLACGFLERVGGRLGFPRRTIATAQKLFHRFHLHFPLTDFAYQDVSLATLLVASKLEDTLKKLREIQIAAWQVTNLLEGGTGMGEGDAAAQEAHRPHLIGIERLVLQTICFNFNLHRSLDPAPVPTGAPPSEASNDALLAAAALAAPPPTRDAFTYLIRIAHSLASLPASLLAPTTTSAPPPPSPDALLKSLTFLAFLLLTDLHRTLAPLSYPPHTCAAACVWLAGFLLVAARGADGEGEVWDAEMVRGWASACESDEEDIDDIAQTLLNLLIALCPSPASSSNSATLSSTTSPLFSPASASPSDSAGALPSGGSKAALSEREKHLLATGAPNAFAHPALAASAGNGVASVDGLTGVKIRLRSVRAAAPPSRKRPRPPAAAAEDDTPELARARRWAALPAGLAEVGRLRDERLAKERVRAEERAERAREEAGAEGGGGGDGRTEEERERERRERRERLRPGSVRYRF